MKIMEKIILSTFFISIFVCLSILLFFLISSIIIEYDTLNNAEQETGIKFESSDEYECYKFCEEEYLYQNSQCLCKRYEIFPAGQDGKPTGLNNDYIAEEDVKIVKIGE